MQTFIAGSETPQLTPVLSFLHLPFPCFSTYAPQGPELPPTHLAELRTPHNCSPRSALTWEDWLQAVACSSREQAWRHALGGNNFNLDPPLPRPQHELRTGFREREEKHRINYRRKKGGTGTGEGGEDKTGRGRKKEGRCKELESRLGWY